ncbi:MAG: DUF6108 family protein [Muribaculaceae bacterium]
MSQILLLFTLLAIAFGQAAAQTGLNIDSAFDGRFRSSPDAVETEISGKALKNSALDIYRSITLTEPALTSEIEALVLKDGAAAETRQVRYIEGRLYYAYYIFKPVDNYRRYLFFINGFLKGGKKMTLIYMAGEATPEQINKLISGRK